MSKTFWQGLPKVMARSNGLYELGSTFPKVWVVLEKGMAEPNEDKNGNENDNNNADYIDYYNNKRIKLKLKMSPVQYQTHFCRQIN